MNTSELSQISVRARPTEQRLSYFILWFEFLASKGTSSYQKSAIPTIVTETREKSKKQHSQKIFNPTERLYIFIVTETREKVMATGLLCF
jgi:hypothetical protein